MAGEYLPPVISRLTMDLGDFAAKIAAAKAMMKDLNGEGNITLNINTDGITKAMAGVAALKAALKDLSGTVKIGTDGALSAAIKTAAAADAGAAASGEAALGRAAAAAAARLGGRPDAQGFLASIEDEIKRLGVISQESYTGSRAAMDDYAASMEKLKGVLDDTGAATVKVDQATRGAANAAKDTGNAAATAALGWGLLTHQFQLFGGAFGNTALIGHIAGWHIALDGLLEAAIALAPALIDLAGGLMAMAPAAQDIYNHLNSVHDVSVALGQTIPPLNGWFEQLQHDVAPNTVEAFGGALNLLKNQTSGLTPIIKQVVTGIDDWVARLDLYGRSQGFANGVLKSGIGFLTQFREVVDNVGMAFMNLMKADPGTAHFLMDFIVGASKVLDLITKLPTPVLMAALALHSMDIWGGLAVSALKNLFIGLLNVGIGATKLVEMLPALMANPFTWVVVAAASIAYLGYQMFQASASAKAFIGSLTQQIGNDSASQAILDINSAIGQLNQQIAFSASSAGIEKIRQSWSNLGNTGQSLAADTRAVGNDFGNAIGQMTGGHIISGLASLARGIEGVFVPGQGAAVVAKNNINAFNGAIVQLTGQQKVLFAESGSLIKQGYTYSQSLALMDLAGVKAGDSAQLAAQKVQNLITGYEGMSVRAGLLANSVNAVTLSTEMQSSQITALTQGWTAFISLVTGGASSFTAFATQMAGLDGQLSGAASTLSVSNGKASIAITGLGAAAGGTKASMTGLNTASIQLRSSFTQGITGASQMMNSLYSMASAAGLGAKGTQMLTQAGKDLVAQLLPAAQNSQEATAQLYALAQQAGYTGSDSFRQLAQWVGNLHNPMANLDSITTKLTVDSANLAADVKNLAEAVNANLNQAMAAAIFQASGGQKAFDAFATAVLKAHGNVSQLYPSAQSLAQQLITVMGNTRMAHDEFDTFSVMLGMTKKQADALWASVVKLGNSIDSLHDKTVTITVNQVNQTATVGSTRLHGYAGGTGGAAPGWAWVGEAGPELVRFRGGESVIPSNVARGYAGGTGGGEPIVVQVHMDGRQVANVVATRAAQRQARTGHNGMAKRSR
jgi:hypothetical protein